MEGRGAAQTAWNQDCGQVQVRLRFALRSKNVGERTGHQGTATAADSVWAIPFLARVS